MRQTVLAEWNEQTVTNFADALFVLAQSFKNESENCSRMCGDLSEKEMAVVFFAGQNKLVKMSDIAESIATPMSTLTNIVDKLADKKLLFRGHCGEDRRVIKVCLSPLGKTMYQRMIDKRKRLAESILMNLNGADPSILTEQLQMLSTKIKGEK